MRSELESLEYESEEVESDDDPGLRMRSELESLEYESEESDDDPSFRSWLDASALEVQDARMLLKKLCVPVVIIR